MGVSSEGGQGPEGAADGMEMEWRPTLTSLTARNVLKQSAKYLKYNIIKHLPKSQVTLQILHTSQCYIK